MDGKSLDIKQDKLKKLKELFPGVFTEDSPFCLSQQVFEVAAKKEGKKSKGYCSVSLLCARC